jgi:cell division protease FtsH
MTAGFTGSEIEAVCDEAGRLAARDDLLHVTKEKFQLALDRKFFGYPKEVTLSRAEEERSAFHEAGHALVGFTSPHTITRPRYPAPIAFSLCDSTQ